jgi:hypothetical protein
VTIILVAGQPHLSLTLPTQLRPPEFLRRALFYVQLVN